MYRVVTRHVQGSDASCSCLSRASDYTHYNHLTIRATQGHGSASAWFLRSLYTERIACCVALHVLLRTLRHCGMVVGVYKRHHSGN